jgi:hypothetical protein
MIPRRNLVTGGLLGGALGGLKAEVPPLTHGRDNLGRYTLLFGQTFLILRVDAAPMLMGVPYDNRWNLIRVLPTASG